MAIVFRVERHSIKGKTCQGDRFGRIRPVSVLWLAMLDSFCARAHSFTQFFSRRRQYKDRFGLFSSFFLRFGSHIRNENREQESRMDSSFWCLGKLWKNRNWTERVNHDSAFYFTILLYSHSGQSRIYTITDHYLISFSSFHYSLFSIACLIVPLNCWNCPYFSFLFLYILTF